MDGFKDGSYWSILLRVWSSGCLGYLPCGWLDDWWEVCGSYW